MLKFPPMYTVEALAAIERTAALAPPLNELITAPVLASRAANRLRAELFTRVKSPPT